MYCGRWCGLEPVSLLLLSCPLESDDLEMKLNIEVCFLPFKGIVFNLVFGVAFAGLGGSGGSLAVGDSLLISTL